MFCGTLATTFLLEQFVATASADVALHTGLGIFIFDRHRRCSKPASQYLPNVFSIGHSLVLQVAFSNAHTPSHSAAAVRFI